MKKIFEKTVWWSGVVMVGLILGISLQFVRAWTEPTVAPPGGNIGAPINTGIIAQAKQGVLQVLGLTVYNDPAVSGVDVTGKVLTAQNANGAVAWAAGGGGASFTYYCNFELAGVFDLPTPPNICTNAGGTQGYCPSGFRQIYDLGSWGNCYCSTDGYHFRPPGGNCRCGSAPTILGKAYVCSQ